MTTGQRIQQARKIAGLSQKQLGEKLGLSASMIGQWENDLRNPKIETLKRIADALDIGVSYLISGGEQVSQTHLANGVHIYKNSFPYKVIEPILKDFPDGNFEILYQDEYLCIIVEENSSTTEADLNEILKAYAPEALIKEKLHNAEPFHKMSDSETHRAEFLQFNSDEDRIAFFYSRLNTDGKLAASKCFYQHLDKASVREVADYVEELSEIPQYQPRTAPITVRGKGYPDIGHPRRSHPGIPRNAEYPTNARCHK